MTFTRPASARTPQSQESTPAQAYVRPQRPSSAPVRPSQAPTCTRPITASTARTYNDHFSGRYSQPNSAFTLNQSLPRSSYSPQSYIKPQATPTTHAPTLYRQALAQQGNKYDCFGYIATDTRHNIAAYKEVTPNPVQWYHGPIPTSARAERWRTNGISSADNWTSAEFNSRGSFGYGDQRSTFRTMCAITRFSENCLQNPTPSIRQP